MLEYRIISSNGFNIYKVKFEGKGKDLKVHCTCPAGKKGGKFCKHISGLINKDTTNLVEPSDKIEALDDVLQGSPLLSKNEDYVNKRENNWFIFNTIKICSIDDLYNYLKVMIDDKAVIEFNKEIKRVAVYKAEYKKDGSPKYVAKNRITFMKYSEDLNSFKVDHQSYGCFAHAGHSFIEGVEKALKAIPS
jgi:hypothetical protein